MRPEAGVPPTSIQAGVSSPSAPLKTAGEETRESAACSERPQAGAPHQRASSSARESSRPRPGPSAAIDDVAARGRAASVCLAGCDWLSLETGRTAHPIRGPLLYVFRVRTQDGGGKQIDEKFNIFGDCISGLCACIYSVDGARTQLKPCRFITKALLKGEPDPDWEYILKGVVFGFDVMNRDCDSSYQCGNYDEVLKGENYKLMSAKLKKEISKEFLSVVDSPMICTHALGCVPKDEGIRGIVDCSRPVDISVNNFASNVASKFKYNSVNDVADMMTGGEFTCTLDISDAFRAVHTHPVSRIRQGLSWDFGEGTVHLKDNRLSMGLSSAPFCFNKISDFVVRVLAREGVTRCVNYLDDYCLVADSQQQGREDQRLLIKILRHLGFDISFRKLSDPAQVTRFLGIDIDSQDMCLRLPADKLKRLQVSVQGYSSKSSATKQELDELAGLLAHCSTVIRGGNTFTRRIYDLCASESRPYAHVKLTEEFQEDILWWKGFAAMFNGSSKIRSPLTPTLGLYSDSSFWGYGAYSDFDWLAGPWDPSNKWASVLDHHYVGSTDVATDENINVLELFPILKAMERWGEKWRDCKICCVTDNTQVMWAIRKGRSKNKFSMVWLREIFWLSVRYNFTLSAVYIASEDNVLCDSLSRLDLPESVRRIRDSMSKDSLCCYHLFNDGPSTSRS